MSAAGYQNGSSKPGDSIFSVTEVGVSSTFGRWGEGEWAEVACVVRYSGRGAWRGEGHCEGAGEPG